MNDFAGEAQPDAHEADAQALAARAAKAGLPVVVVDRQGDLCDAILREVLRDAPERTEDVVLVDFDDQEWPVAFNPLDIDAPEEIRSAVDTFRTLLSERTDLTDRAAPRALHLAAEVTAALADANLTLAEDGPRLTFIDVPGLMQRDGLRRDVMAAAGKGTGAFESLAAYDRMTDRERAQAALPLLRAFSPVGNSRHLANLLGTERTKLDFVALAAEGRIVLVRATGPVNDPAGFGAFIDPWLTAAIGSATASWDRTELAAMSGPGAANPHGTTVTVTSPTLVRPLGAGTRDAGGNAPRAQEATTLEQIRTRSRALVCNPRNEVETRRSGRLASVRAALVAVSAGGHAAGSAA